MKTVKFFGVSRTASLLGLLILGLAFVLLLLSPKGSHAENSRVITIYHDAVEQTVVTDAPTVAEVLKRAGVQLSDVDSVEPARDMILSAPSYSINVYRARPVTVVDGQSRYQVVTPHTSARLIAEQAGLVLYDEDLTAISRINDFIGDQGVGIKLTIERAKLITLVMYGRQQDVRTQAKDVSALMKEKGIELGPDDGTSLSGGTPIVEGMRLEIWRNGVQTVTSEEEIPFSTDLIRATDKPAGYREVQTTGVKGKKLVTYEIELRNGVEVRRKQIQSVTTLQPVKQLEVVGGTGFSTNEQILYALRICEAGGNYQRNSGNGFYGAYQFMVSTWNRVAPKIGRADLVGVRPDLAAPADQDLMVISNARLSSGGFATQHPGCYKKLGLPVKPF